MEGVENPDEGMTQEQAEEKVVETFGEGVKEEGVPSQPVADGSPEPTPEQVATDDVVEGVSESEAPELNNET